MSEARVLDHGYIRLVDHMGSDLSIVRSARVSYDADWRAGEDAGSDKRLINYLMKNQHTSPFESVEFQFEVKAPIFVLRQWHRHRTWSFNEISGRYAELPEEFYIPEPGAVGVQSKSSKQAREFDPSEFGLTHECMEYIEDLQSHSRQGFRLYQYHLAKGIPRELARLFLGLNTYSKQFAKVDLHNLLRFIDIRIHKHAQYEIRVYAEQIIDLIQPIVPVAIDAWRANRDV